MADSVTAAAHESNEDVIVTAPTNNLRCSKRIPQIHTAQNIASNHASQVEPRVPRVPRSIDPVQRRKKG
jgi:hypothetical protein